MGNGPAVAGMLYGGERELFWPGGGTENMGWLPAEDMGVHATGYG